MRYGKRGLVAVATAALAVTPALVGATSGGTQARKLSATACGSTITSSVTLTANMSCAGDGLDVGKDGIVINLNGFTISGGGSSSGIAISNHNSVTVQNGVISDFGDGVDIEGTSKSTHVTGVRLDGDSVGVFSESGGATVVTGSWIVGTGEGISVFLDAGDQFTKNFIQGTVGSGSGISALGVTNVTISGNSLLGNTGDGLALNGTGLVTGNIASGNTQNGIEATSTPTGVKAELTITNNRASFNGALGIKVNAAGAAVDGGGNVVQDNTTASQCQYVACHAVSN